RFRRRFALIVVRPSALAPRLPAHSPAPFSAPRPSAPFSPRPRPSPSAGVACVTLARARDFNCQISGPTPGSGSCTIRAARDACARWSREPMHLADYLVILAVLVSAIVGAVRGFLREAVAFATVILAIFLA